MNDRKKQSTIIEFERADGTKAEAEFDDSIIDFIHQRIKETKSSGKSEWSE